MPEDADALFAKILTLGLRADYEALIERRDLDALKVIKDSRATAEKLLMVEPNYYDAYLAIGVENYLFSLKPAPMRWILQAGRRGDRRRQRRRGSAFDRGKRLLPVALCAAAAGRGCAAQQRYSQGPRSVGALAREFPHNRLYAQELAQLQ